MPTTRLDPTSIGADDGWNLGAGASKTAAVTWPDDDGTTQIFGNFFSSLSQGFNMSDLPPEAVEVQSHTARMREWMENAPEGDEFINLFHRTSGGTYSHGSNFQDTAGYTTRTHANLGGSMTVAAVNSSQIGVRGTGLADDFGGGQGQVRCSTISWDVTYLTIGGGFVSFILSLGPVVGAALSLEHFPGLNRLLWLKRRTAYGRNEWRGALDEWRGYRRTKYLWLRGEGA